ncbi:hypothetical protein EDB86DRAFT_2868940 [Lactarius hatsudake]|nr:hypothetical protein EDB86DRAFT_2868940 [Lactarius hatsudake]
MTSTLPGDPAYTRAHIPLLSPPFDDSDGLQSNARFDSYSTSTKRRTPQIGLGLVFGGSDFLSHLDGHPAVDPLLDSPQLTASPAEPFCLDRFSGPENSSFTTDEAADTAAAAGAALDTSSSAFSIRDWIIQPSSSPDALSRSPTPPPHTRHVGPTHEAPSEPTEPHADVNLIGVASTLPRTPASIDTAMLADSLARSLSENVDGPPESMERVFLQVVQHLYLSPCFSRVPPVGCLSPGRTSIPGKPSDCAPLCAPEAEVANAQPLDVMYSGSNFRACAGEPFSTPVDASGGFTGANFLAASSVLTSPREFSNNDVIVSPDTPMFNMHQGISEYDLQRRASRYRRRYPGKSLDRHWLSRYAGKLNKDGKAIEDYRCYISGCAQLNKRRDHIIVHICSHVNERPFACCHCHMTFLRRNECKRHEAGHSGLKPFVCRLCPSPAARFSRQDLLTRHAKRAHDMAAQEQREKRQLTPEVDGSIRKRARVSALYTKQEMYLE